MKKVFISYGREDLDSAEKLYKRLKSLSDVQVWYDQVHLLPGVSWKPAIRKAIRESDYFLALLSTSSVKHAATFRRNEKTLFLFWTSFLKISLS
jgi:hypothetical protein